MNIIPKYVSSHDSVYSNVSKAFMLAGGGVMRTFNNTNPRVREQLRVLWKSDGYTPHAISAHTRVPQHVVDEVQAAFASMSDSEAGVMMLGKMKLKGFEKAVNSDWYDVRALKINEL